MKYLKKLLISLSSFLFVALLVFGVFNFQVLASSEKYNDQKIQKISKDLKPLKTNVTKNEYQKKIFGVKNEKIKKSLIELTKVFREK